MQTVRALVPPQIQVVANLPAIDCYALRAKVFATTMCRAAQESPFREGKEIDMDRALSLLISAGIVVFGVWITAYTMPVSLGWTPLGVLTIITGLISLYGVARPTV